MFLIPKNLLFVNKVIVINTYVCYNNFGRFQMEQDKMQLINKLFGIEGNIALKNVGFSCC